MKQGDIGATAIWRRSAASLDMRQPTLDESLRRSEHRQRPIGSNALRTLSG
jgi:hypothetical protein